MRLFGLMLEILGLVLRFLGYYLIGYGCGLAAVAATILIFTVSLWCFCFAIVNI